MNEIKEVKEKADKGELIQYIVIKIDDEQYGINIKFIDNIVRMQQITRVPKVDAFLKGVINIRGEIVPVMSVRMKMGLSEDVITGASRIIILKTEAGDLVGIIVDQVNQVLTLNEKDIEKVRYDDKKGQSKVSFVSGVGHYDGGLVSILDLDAVVSEKESKEKASNAS
ncbi:MULTISPECIES: chemotaxis protein CheW [Butyrivibrio]|jgi:purine-binding chemotaxis protein CheW|uniref:chemotaxis protein CheW n=1 Tax=Butyrivibrio TaxID=830 RepID=UPI0003FC0F31|nr:MULTISPECIES: chemotaxis protein CheW [Butyrivibrio]SFU33977.1 purine-binding chemotaxis protein CheW [Butyrivibrio sp. M55]